MTPWCDSLIINHLKICILWVLLLLNLYYSFIKTQLNDNQISYNYSLAESIRLNWPFSFDFGTVKVGVYDSLFEIPIFGPNHAILNGPVLFL